MNSDGHAAEVIGGTVERRVARAPSRRTAAMWGISASARPSTASVPPSSPITTSLVIGRNGDVRPLPAATTCRRATAADGDERTARRASGDRRYRVPRPRSSPQRRRCRIDPGRAARAPAPSPRVGGAPRSASAPRGRAGRPGRDRPGPRSAAAAASGSAGGTTRPVTPASTSSGVPPTLLTTAGSAADIASWIAIGDESKLLRWANTSTAPSTSPIGPA